MKYLFLTLLLLSSIPVSYADFNNLSTPENTLIAHDKAWMKMDIEGIRLCLDGLSSREIEEFRQAMLSILQYSKYTKNKAIEMKQVSATEIHIKTKKEFYDSTYTTKYEEKTAYFVFKLEDKEWKIDSQTMEDQIN